jgi:hypothetical protein
MLSPVARAGAEAQVTEIPAPEESPAAKRRLGRPRVPAERRRETISAALLPAQVDLLWDIARLRKLPVSRLVEEIVTFWMETAGQSDVRAVQRQREEEDR